MCNDRKHVAKIHELDILGDLYADHPIIRAMVALVGVLPPVSALDALVVAQWEKAKKERFKVLLDELSKGEKHLTEEIIQQEDFLYAFVSVTRASIFTRQTEKIHLFARLLTNACERKKLGSDEFDESLSILSELSPRELKLLLLFKKHEDRLKTRAEEQLENHRISQWNALANEVERELAIPHEHLNSALSRLERTGLYQTLPGSTFASDETLGSGNTTPRLIEFLQWILDENDNLESAPTVTQSL